MRAKVVENSNKNKLLCVVIIMEVEGKRRKISNVRLKKTEGKVPLALRIGKGLLN